jgi:RNA polymerase sigma factor (sigma-70 family)
MLNVTRAVERLALLEIVLRARPGHPIQSRLWSRARPPGLCGQILYWTSAAASGVLRVASGRIVLTMNCKRSGHRAAPTMIEWLGSPYLERAAARVGHQYGLATDDLPDLIQEVRIALWEAGSEIRRGPAWIHRVASHKAVDSLRRKMRTRDHDRALATTLTPAQRDEELGHLLHARDTTLPPRLRQFYDLHYRQGFSEREIARRLGICRASVRWLDRCCRRLIAEATFGTGRGEETAREPRLGERRT